MAAAEVASKSCLVQYVVVRTDLLLNLSWSVGAVISQACHAATAVIHLHYRDPDTQQYLAELDSMHKVVLGVRILYTGPRCSCPSSVIYLLQIN